jgi:hypothetical protein
MDIGIAVDVGVDMTTYLDMEEENCLDMDIDAALICSSRSFSRTENSTEANSLFDP